MPQLRLLERAEGLLRPDPAVLALVALGSVARGTADAWSDLDLLVVVADGRLAAYDPALPWLARLADVLAAEHYPGEGRGTTRAWLGDIRADIVVAEERRLAEEGAWPLWGGVEVRFSRSSAVDRLLAQPHLLPQLPLMDEAGFHALVDQFWFAATVSLGKVARGDLLIALHLCLEAVQAAAVLGMALRDRAEGTTFHATGGSGNARAARLRPPAAGGATEIIEALAHAAAAFDELASEWSPAYRPRLPAFRPWLDRARGGLEGDW